MGREVEVGDVARRGKQAGEGVRRGPGEGVGDETGGGVGEGRRAAASSSIPIQSGGREGDIFGGWGEVSVGVSGSRWLRERVGWPAGPGGLAQLGHRPRVFSSFFCFVISFLLFIFFSVLNHFNLSRHFIKMCLLHHIYLCKIWHLPNIFVLNFEKLLLLTLI